MKKVCKIGILGGAMDPPTKGHIALAEKVLNEKLVDQVWLEPCYSHNYGKEMTDPAIRIEMCKLAAKKNDRITVSEFEITQKLTGGTLRYIKMIKESFALINAKFDKELGYTYEFYIIIGLDNANTFHKWANYKELMKEVPFIVVSRKGVERDWDVDWYTKEPHQFLKTVEIPNTSSTEVREIIRSGNKNASLKLMSLLDDSVRKYVLKNHLYEK